jgi:integrase
MSKLFKSKYYIKPTQDEINIKHTNKITSMGKVEPKAISKVEPKVNYKTEANCNLKSNGVRKTETADALTIEEAKAISVVLFHKENKRDWCWFNLNLFLGLRASDLLSLKFEDFFTKSWIPKLKIKIVEQKRGKVRYIPINNQVQKILNYYLNLKREEYIKQKKTLLLTDYMFSSRKRDKNNNTRPIGYKQAWAILNAVGEELGIDKDILNISTHSMRKSFGKFLYDNGVPVEIIQDIYGHSSGNDTLRYIGIRKEQKENAYKGIEIEYLNEF